MEPGYARVRANGKCKQPTEGWKSGTETRAEGKVQVKARHYLFRLAIRPGIARNFLACPVVCRVRRQGPPRPSFRAVVLSGKKKKSLGVFFQLPGCSRGARPAWESRHINAVYKRTFFPCVWLIGENNLSIASLFAERARRRYIRGRVLKSRILDSKEAE